MSNVPPSPATIKSLVQAQFAPSAAAYVTSSTHAHGADLARLIELAQLSGHESVLDVATGGGHTALACAPQARHVVASDLTLAMLHEARKYIQTHAIPNVTYCRSEAEHLAFADASFERVTCRIAAHHFADVRAFAREAARVLKPGGLLLVSDHIGLEDPEYDQFMDRFERWRDPSHVRAYTFSEWRTFCQAAGLEIIHTEDDPRESYDFASWAARLRMPDHERDQLAAWLLAAPSHLREYFAVVEAEGTVKSLRSTFGIFVAIKR